MCTYYVHTYVYTMCTYYVYIRIHPVHVLRVHTYCLGGVLLEGLRIRLTSDYSVEAAEAGMATSHYTQGLVNIPNNQM